MSRRTTIERLEHRVLMASQTFAGSGTITMSDSGFPPFPANPYPATINVSGVSGNVTNLRVNFPHLTHNASADLDVLLVNPAGDSILLMSDCGSSANNAAVVFDDSGIALPNTSSITSNTYRPTNRDDFSDDSIPGAPNSGDPTGTRLSDLTSGDLNGTWSLYIVDDTFDNSTGSISGPWSITIDTQVAAPAPPSTPDLSSASDSGVSNSDDITNVTLPTFTGTATAGTTVKILSDGAQIGSAAATAAGTYTVTATTALTNGPHNITATATDGSGTSQPSGALAITVDTVAPTVTSRTFNHETSQNIVYGFSENVGPTLGTNDFQISNLTGVGATPALTLAYNASTNQATITFASILSDGWWGSRAGAPGGGGVTDVAGNPMGTDVRFTFPVLAADANGDQKVDVTDLGVLATNWQSSGQTFSTGDFNYDGRVDVTDLGILATNWQKSLGGPPPAAPIAAARVANTLKNSSRMIDQIDPPASSILN